MAQEPAQAPQQVPALPVIVDTPSATVVQKTNVDERVAEFLREIQENAGQIAELMMEEGNLVNEFFDFLLKILKPFAKTLEISVSALPESYRGRVNRAYLYLNGQLVMVQKNDELEILNLSDVENRELLVQITGEITLRLKALIDVFKSKTEKRVQFFMWVTKELQKISEVFNEK